MSRIAIVAAIVLWVALIVVLTAAIVAIVAATEVAVMAMMNPNQLLQTQVNVCICSPTLLQFGD